VECNFKWHYLFKRKEKEKEKNFPEQCNKGRGFFPMDFFADKWIFSCLMTEVSAFH